jgi:hypothetical protein
MKFRPAFTLVLVLVLLVSGMVLAADNYNLSWWTVDGGGGVSTSLNLDYTLSGTIGQPDAGAVASGGGYTLAGGFWHGGAPVPAEMRVHLPLVVR